MYVVNTLAPVFLIIILGVLLQKISFLSPQLSRESNRLVYWQMSLPLALLSIGVSLATTRVSGQVALSVLATLLKVAGAPLLGVLLANWMGLSAAERTIALLYLACPTAVASYIMAEQLGGDETLTSSTIVLSTLLSALVLAIILSVSS